MTLYYVDYLTQKYPEYNIRLIKNYNGFIITKTYKNFLFSYEENFIKISIHKVKSDLKNHQ